MPILVDLHADPFEAAVSRGHSYEYDKWAAQRMFVFVPAQAIVAEFMGTFKEFPPRQKPASFSVGDALSQLQTATQGR
jgi:arylsulfatase